MHISEGNMLPFLTNLPPDTCMSHGIIHTALTVTDTPARICVQHHMILHIAIV
jgi:hypothetical protein